MATIDFILAHWAELLLAVMALAKTVLNLMPSESPAQNVFALLDKIVTAITGDNVKPPELPDDFNLR